MKRCPRCGFNLDGTPLLPPKLEKIFLFIRDYGGPVPVRAVANHLYNQDGYYYLQRVRANICHLRKRHLEHYGWHLSRPPYILMKIKKADLQVPAHENNAPAGS